MNRKELLKKAKLYVDKLSKGVDPISEKQLVLNEKQCKLLNCFSDLSMIFDEILVTKEEKDTYRMRIQINHILIYFFTRKEGIL